jgi:N-acetylneuraminate synthase
MFKLKNGRLIGRGHPVYIIGEIGINHCGLIGDAKGLCFAAAKAGCDAVKFQKRTVDVVYSQEELLRPRKSIYGETNGDLKRGLELSKDQYIEVRDLCLELQIDFLASCWDPDSVDFIEWFDPVAYKIASASITDLDLLKYTAGQGRPLILSTGMSTLEEIDRAVEAISDVPYALLHCVSTYPSNDEDLNLNCIATLESRYGCPVGYSGHELGLATTVAAVALGACIVERHITLDRAMWGSDQAASIEPQGLERLVRDIRAVESAMGDGVKRVLDDEVPIIEKLRRIK